MPPGVVPSPERRSASGRTPLTPTRAGMPAATHCHPPPSLTRKSTLALDPDELTTTTWAALAGSPSGSGPHAGAGAHAGGPHWARRVMRAIPNVAERRRIASTVAVPIGGAPDPVRATGRGGSPGRQRAMKYLACGWWQMIAEVVCSGWYCQPVSSDTSMPRRSASSSRATVALSSRSGHAG